MKYTLLQTNDASSITALIDGELYTATDEHPFFVQIVEAVVDGTATPDTFNGEAGVLDYLQLADGVEVRDSVLYYDDEPMHDALAQKIIKMLKANEEPTALVNFLIWLKQNPSRNSRDQLFGWLEQSGFEITDTGYIIGYKSVYSVRDSDQYHSVSRGTAWVNGEKQTGQIYQKVGDVVTMPRSDVTDNPAESCSYGLHVGTRGYAESFSGDTVLLVYVNPKDVVSVPNDDATKMRVCEYVAGEVFTPELVEEEPDVEVGEHYFFVNSSLIKRGTWTPDEYRWVGALELTLSSGKSYTYRDVPFSKWTYLVAEDEAGNASYYFNNFIKDCYALV